MIGRMKLVSDKRKLEISVFSSVVRAAGQKLIPNEGDDDRRDADRIRAIADYLGIANPSGHPSPAVKKWWYGQNAPARPAAKLIVDKLEQIAG